MNTLKNLISISNDRQTEPPSKTGIGKIVFQFLLPCLLFSVPVISSAQDFTQTIERKARFANLGNEDNELRVYNICGSVTIKGYEGEDIELTVVQEIDGTPQEVELGKEELSLQVKEEGSLILVYIDAPFISLKRKGDRIHYRMDRWEDDYEFLYDITIRVPTRSHIYASTINRGTVTVENTTRSITARNVNGKVILQQISGPTNAHTVNGDITARYAQSPDRNSEYETVNGTIEVNYPKDLSADIRFKSMHGELYTDFQNVERLQARVTTDTRKNRGETTYRLDRFAPLRIGNGGPIFNFEVLNGDVYIKQIKS